MSLTDFYIERKTKPAAVQREYSDKANGLSLCVFPSGIKSWIVRYRSPVTLRTAKYTIGPLDRYTLAEARAAAREVMGMVDRKIDPLHERKAQKNAAAIAAANTVAGLVEVYFAKEGPKLRSRAHRLGIFRNHILPALGARPISSIRRGDVTRLLDAIEAEASVRVASLSHAYLSKLFRWHSLRDDTFVNPIVPGMNADRVTTKRDRVLSDDELRAYVRAARSWDGQHGRYMMFLMYTACRRDEAAFMTWDELSADGAVWTIPKARHKSGWRKDAADVVLPLSAAAQAILTACQRIVGDDRVFTTAGGNAGYLKKLFDARMAAEFGGPVSPWTLHDVRRTARSLMARAGVRPDHAERALGHVIKGVEGVYDRHSYELEKLAAFEALAAEIERLHQDRQKVKA